jgi:transcriptional regulator with XRE-family HTH domain
LEAALGFGNSTISKWDSVSPTLAKIEAVANYFEVPVSSLIGEEEKKPIPEDELDAELKRLLMDLRPDEADKVRAYVQGMIANRK